LAILSVYFPENNLNKRIGSVFVRLFFAILSACGIHFRASTRPSASILTCALNFQPFGPNLGLRPQYTAL